MLRKGKKLLLTGAVVIFILAFVVFVPVLYYNPGCVEIYKSIARAIFGFGGELYHITGQPSGEVTGCSIDPGVDNQFHYVFHTSWQT